MNLEALRARLKEFISGTEFVTTSYLAGGCVRDWLMGKVSTDLDITVELDQGGIRLAEYLAALPGFTAFHKYPEFGTAKLKWGDKSLEFTQTRKEVYYPRSRHPKVSFGTLYDDVWRRDFTINALLMELSSGQVLDICGRGLADLRQGLIRSVGNPHRIFREDPLRILRAIRFSARFGFEIEPDTWEGLCDNVKRVLHLSESRISSELEKVFTQTEFHIAQRLMVQSGILQAVSANPNKAALFRVLMSDHPLTENSLDT